MRLRKKIVVSKQNFYDIHLNLVNAILPIKLTNKEIELLSSFMFFSGCIDLHIFELPIKKLVKEKFSLSSAGLSNYLAKLKDKGFILVKEERLCLLPLLFLPIDKVYEYDFKLEIGNE